MKLTITSLHVAIGANMLLSLWILLIATGANMGVVLIAATFVVYLAIAFLLRGGKKITIE